MTVFVQFKDSSAAEIVSTFSSQQDGEVFDNLGEVEDDDNRLAIFNAQFQRGNGPISLS